MIVSLPTPRRPRDDHEHRARRAVHRRLGSSSRRRRPCGRSVTAMRTLGARRPSEDRLRARPAAAPSARIRCPSVGEVELEPPGVEEQPIEPVRAAARRPGAVHRVARDRVTDRVEVDADLVRPPGDEVELQQRPAGESLAHAVAGDRRPPVGHDGHPRPVLRVAPDRRLDPADRRRRPMPWTSAWYVFLIRRALSWAMSEACARSLPGDHQQPARVAVQAVDDARPLDAGDPARTRRRRHAPAGR